MLVLAALTAIAAACSSTPTLSQTTSSSPASESSKDVASGTQVNEGGQVSVSVTWKGPQAGPVFLIEMNTHSVDLDNVDLSSLATLKTPQGDLAPSAWEAPKGGHHRSGQLSFPSTLPDGTPTVSGGPLDLVIRDVAGVPERSFAWQP